jgi:hypothetical protein
VDNGPPPNDIEGSFVAHALMRHETATDVKCFNANTFRIQGRGNACVRHEPRTLDEAMVSQFGGADKNVCSTKWVVSQFGGADILVCPVNAADKNVCSTKWEEKNLKPGNKMCDNC